MHQVQLHRSWAIAMAGSEDIDRNKELKWKEFFRDEEDNGIRNRRSSRQPHFTHNFIREPFNRGHNSLSSLVSLERGSVPDPHSSRAVSVSSVPDTLLPSLLRACCKKKDLSTGTRIHHELYRRGLPEMNYSDALVTMYSKCGELSKAQALLEMHQSSSVITWTALIAGYARQGEGQNALDCFERMRQEGIIPNAVTYTCILKACAVIKALEKGKQFHDEVMRQGLLEHHAALGGALVDMYAKCGELSQAKSVLEKLPSRDVISWSALITGYVQIGQGQQALECFQDMQLEGIRPNAVTYLCILKACAVLGAVDKGKQIHDEVSRQGLLERSVLLGGALMDMYAKCGALPQARSVLEKLPSRNAVLWSTLISGYASQGQGQQALECFDRMQQEGIPPNAVTYLSILKACASIGAINEGKHVHDEILKQGLLEHDIVLGNALVDMYAKCGALPQARGVLKKLPFRDVVSWSALIAGYAQHGQGQQALECFEQMQQEGVPPDIVTYVCILKSCALIGALDMGKQIHDEISRWGLLEHNISLGGALVDMYAKCGALPQAQSVLEKLPWRDVVLWTALIAGYAQKGQGQFALECYEQMQREGVSPNSVTYVSILKACAVIGAIDKGKQIHDEISRLRLLEHDIVLGSALVDMYAKCGALPQAQNVLEKLPFRDVVLWNALVAGYAQEGQGEQALRSFDQMQSEGILPDKVTFICLLNMCSHLGLVENGQELFDTMGATYGLKPDVDCFICMVNLLGRAGHIVKAVELIKEMPCSPNLAIWLCLLGGCLKWVEVNVGIWAFEQAVELDKCEGAAYVLMVNLYAAAGMMEKAKDIEAMRRKNIAWKQPVCRP